MREGVFALGMMAHTYLGLSMDYFRIASGAPPTQEMEWQSFGRPTMCGHGTRTLNQIALNLCSASAAPMFYSIRRTVVRVKLSDTFVCTQFFRLSFPRLKAGASRRLLW
jgi:hypothetical protein